MTAAEAIEYRITRQLLARGQTPTKAANAPFHSAPPQTVNWTDRLIAILATTVSLFVLGSFLEELVWVVIAAGTIITLGVNE